MVEDGIRQGAPPPSSNLVPFGRWGYARGRGHCRGKPGRVQQHVQGYYGPCHPVSKHQVRRRWRANRSPTSEGSAAPSLCARIIDANQEVSEA